MARASFERLVPPRTRALRDRAVPCGLGSWNTQYALPCWGFARQGLPFGLVAAHRLVVVACVCMGQTPDGRSRIEGLSRLPGHHDVRPPFHRRSEVRYRAARGLHSVASNENLPAQQRDVDAKQ